MLIKFDDAFVEQFRCDAEDNRVPHLLYVYLKEELRICIAKAVAKAGSDYIHIHLDKYYKSDVSDYPHQYPIDPEVIDRKLNITEPEHELFLNVIKQYKRQRIPNYNLPLSGWL